MDVLLLKKLIEIESTSGNEVKIIKEIQQIAINLKIPHFKQEENIVFNIKGKNRKQAIIFNGHVDTVSAGNLGSWKFKPYGKSITINKVKVYGLGTSDMKAGVFSFIEVAKWFNKNSPPIDVWFSFVVKEEIDGSGTKSFINWFKKHKMSKYTKLAGVIGEPTALNAIYIGHKGNYFIKIKTIGDSGHGAYPERINKHAVLEMFKVIKKLQLLEKHWQKKYSHSILGKPTIGLLTSIEAGDIRSPNKYPDDCTASFDIRTTPDMHQKVLQDLQKNLRKNSCEIELISDPASYSYTNPSEKIIKTLKSIVGDLPLKTANGASDQYFFSEVGIPAICFGPGEREVILKPNEFCYLNKIKESIEIYKKIVQNFS